MSLTKAKNRMIDGASANVKDFGAKGDGVTDDTAAFQAAVNTLKKVYVPNGSYVIGGVEVDSYSDIVGENSVRTILLPSANNVDMIKVLTSAADLKLSNFRVSGNSKSGVTFFNQIDKSRFISHPIFNNIICDAQIEYGFRGSFIYGTWEHCRFGLGGDTSSYPRHVAILCKDDSTSPAAGHVFSVGALVNCSFFSGKTDSTANALGAYAMVNIWNGDVWSFSSCTFESASGTTKAIYSEGTRELLFESCWFEAVGDTSTLKGKVSSLSSHGTIFSCYGCRFSNASGPTTSVFELDAASSGTLINSEFVLGATGLKLQSGGGRVTEQTSITYDSVPSGFNNILDKDRYKRSGVFDVALSTGSGTVTIDPDFNSLAYTLNGPSCHVQGRVRVSAVSSPSGTLVMTGLPFTSSDESETPDVVFSEVAYESLASSVANGLLIKLGSDSTSLAFNEQTATTLDPAVANRMQVGTLLYINLTYIIA